MTGSSSNRPMPIRRRRWISVASWRFNSSIISSGSGGSATVLWCGANGTLFFNALTRTLGGVEPVGFLKAGAERTTGWLGLDCVCAPLQRMEVARNNGTIKQFRRITTLE
jgi:hypothetical protein